MWFNSVSITNFLSYGKEQTIQLSKQGLIAVLGENKDSQAATGNGTGKSALFDSVVWALYGETGRGYRGDDVINRKYGKGCIVSLALSDSVNNYVITRCRNIDSKRKNDLVLVINGQDVSMANNADTQEKINNIIGMDFDTFCQSVLLSHSSRSFSSMTDKEQKAVLEDILQIGWISAAKDKTKIRLVEEQDQLRKIETDIQICEMKLAQSSQKLEQFLKVKEHQLQTEKLRVIAERADRFAKIEEILEGIDNRPPFVELDFKIKELRDELKSNDKLISEANNKLKDFQAKIASKISDMDKKSGRLTERRRNLLVRISNFNKMSNVACPTCAQEVTLSYAAGLISADQEELTNVNEELNYLENTKESTLKQQVQLQSLVKDATNKYSARSNFLRDEINRFNNALTTCADDIKNINNLNDEVEKLFVEFIKENPLDDDIKQERKRVFDYKHELRDLQEAQLGIQRIINHLEYWSHGFSNQGIKSYVLDSVIPYLNQRVQYYSDILSNGDLKIEFSTQTTLKSGASKEQFQVKVVNKHGADEYQGNSAGEKRRVDIAVGWALGDLAATRANIPIHLKMLDEPFESLDEIGKDSVVRLLRTVLSEYETILCVTHSDHLKSQFPKEITIVKENGESTIQIS